VTSRSAAVAWLAAVVFLGAHLPFLSGGLEDLDSINFALGLRTFDVAQHQPHPPGYPIFIFLARAAASIASSEGMALRLVSAFAGAMAVVGTGALFRTLSPERWGGWTPAAALAFSATAPLFWVTAARPLSDMAGLAVAIAAQVLTLRASTVNGLGAAALMAGAAVGVRSQVVWLTVPMLVVACWRRPDARARAALVAAAGYGVGVLAWAIPLVALSGGVVAYLRTLSAQGAEDFTGVVMLATQPSPRLLLSALQSTVLAPWGAWWMGAVILLAALAGLGRLMTRDRQVLGALLTLFGPYAVFHLLFQETVTTRYALPLVLPAAYLAAVGVSIVAGHAKSVVAASVAVGSLVIGSSALSGYASAPAPAFRVLEDLRVAAQALPVPPALAMHRRQELDMRRPLLWNRDRLPVWSAHLPAPPTHEWLEVVRYWNAGGRAPVWFLADPPRSDLRLVDPRSVVKRGSYRWVFGATELIGGVRPNVMDWYEIGLPTWYLGEGWALTPESAGVAKDEQRGPGRQPIQGWVRRHARAATLMIGGRNFAAGGPSVPVVVSLDGRVVFETSASPGYFLRFARLEPGVLSGDGDVASLTVTAGTDELAIEQFDLQAETTAVFGFGEGWHESEYNPSTGRLWRWTSDRATLRVRAPRRAHTLTLTGEFETGVRTAHVVIKSGDRVIAERDLDPRFSWEVAIPPDALATEGETVLTLETDQWYVPAETNWRPTQDRRRLGLRVFTCELREAS
jgi:hypothetical protein